MLILMSCLNIYETLNDWTFPFKECCELCESLKDILLVEAFQ